MNLCLNAALLTFSWHAAFAGELPQNQSGESGSLAMAGKTKCDMSEPSITAAGGSEPCIIISHRISGHVRVDMGSRLPAGSLEVWPGGQILPVRAASRSRDAELPDHLRLDTNEGSGVGR